MASRGVLIAGALCIAAGGAAGLAMIPRPVERPAQAGPIPNAGSDEVRVRFSAAESPLVVLPGGRRETIHSVLNIREPMRFGAYVWNEAGVPDGPVWVRVDLTRQLISVFRAGHEIGSAVILYGAEGKQTPLGWFSVLQKAEDYHSYTYDAPMPFMLRLTEDGVAIHGSDVREGSATHGCIGVPLEFARKVFGVVRMGDPVAIVNASSKVDAI